MLRVGAGHERITTMHILARRQLCFGGIAFPARLIVFGQIIISLSVGGCKSDPPDVANTTWDSITVSYCDGSGPDVVMKTWTSEDEPVLTTLRTSLKIRSWEGRSTIAGMRTNEITIGLSDGQELVMNIFDAERIGLYDKKNTYRSYSLSVDSFFVETLRAIVKKHAGGDVIFWYSREVNIRK